ncbi:flagellar M-ring protein FliF [Baekduia soli]|uniref:Flagellar M-ring protein n=1 Tax=Baekduia soli TaxID=496014 RepID=A0A5B8U1H2_9ACTN|nr:flagellar basal-body MS-ring/collar protein FliF [Baekduia soli]QEC46836.1 flagellar M-ring protein FliF [Baekduia soli]
MALLNSMSTKGKLTLAGCALAFLAAAVLIMKMAGAPSYTTVMTGVDPAKASQITAALSAVGVSSEIQNGGTAIAVQKGKETLAATTLAAKGLNSTSTQPGFEILDKQKLGASSQQQQIAYQRGLEGTIANTVSQIQGASGAQVHLTLPQDNLFADESRGATAAVLLPNDGSALDGNAVRGIANLVASSVPGLKASAVTITDGSGAMLWPAADGGSDSGGLPAKTAAETRYNLASESDLQSLLDRTLGPGKAQVEVHSDLNVDKIDQQALTYGTKGVPQTEKKQTETLTGAGAGAAAGAAGTASNLPGYAAGSATGGSAKNNYKNTTTDSAFAIDKKITKTTVAPGAVNNLQVSVLVDKNAKLAAADITALNKTLSSAAGIQAKRGDVLTINQVAFAKQPAAAKAAGLPIPPAFAGILKGVGIGLGALMFLFFVTRHLRKRERETLTDEPSWLRQLEAHRPTLEIPESMLSPAGEAMPPVANGDPRRQQLETLISQDPERVATHLRQWITEDAH